MASAKLDFKFAPIDLEILTHPRMVEACAGGDVTPFAVWSATVIYVTKHKTSGVISRTVIDSLISGGDRSSAVKKLIAVGLFIEREDGRIEVWNHAKKSPKPIEEARSKAAQRQANYMARKRAKASNDHASSEPREGVSDDVSNDVIRSTLSLLPSKISSPGRSEEPSSTPRATPQAEPPWVDEMIAAVAMSTGETFDRGTVWTVYQGGREDAGKLPSPGDFRRFLGSWAARQKRDRVNDRARGFARPNGGGGPRGDRQPIGNWMPPTGTDDSNPFGGDS